jgi:hypothetical protein
LRSPRPRGSARPGSARRHHAPHRAVPAAVAGAVDLLAVLGGLRNRAAGLPQRRQRRAAAHRLSGNVPEPRGIRGLRSGAGGRQDHHGLHLCLGRCGRRSGTRRWNCA